MMNHSLIFARAYEKETGGKIPASARPIFHLTPWVGWMNDPNGFSYYRGQYHLFYQYNPYDTQWDAMHWGHAVSHDLLHWTYLPAALAPDAPYDSFGCFSGSAMELPDGKQLLLYTGVRKEGGDKGKEYQTQCVAVGDGMDYQKYARNPVLDAADLPEGLSPYDFRDPKIWRKPDGGYRCVVGARRMDKRGVLLLYDSDDGFHWQFTSILAENDGRFGLMWECPDFFPLDGKDVLFVSPQDMLPEGFEYHNGNGTVCQIGTFDEETKRFIPEHNQAIDYGIDFYAPQTLLTPDGRRVMIGWMQNWDTCKNTGYEDRQWFGQMSLPRELSIRSTAVTRQNTKTCPSAIASPWMVLRAAAWKWISASARRTRPIPTANSPCVLPRTTGIIPFSASGPMNPCSKSTANSPAPAGPTFTSAAARWRKTTAKSACM